MPGNPATTMLYAKVDFVWSCPHCSKGNVASNALCCKCNRRNLSTIPDPSAIHEVICQVFGGPVAIL
ncbi:hypothetical protein BD410DRAFT_794972 [Rickenella mellea]|uniref:RanBP2-type domain-containing protein n=1 Tax=Rickenella mellea TaxID=50990 RepID=A0A4Y7PQC9_9AGAM|nr:hypothetical protein BD410DRAFT_794972 [Rickenella mellea]